MSLATIAQSKRLCAVFFFNAFALLLLSAASAAAQGVTFSGRQIPTGGQYQIAADFKTLPPPGWTWKSCWATATARSSRM
jgi:hypothetical protein